MFESREYKRVEKILDKKSPSYRKAYSDRLAWLMAYMAQLAYLKFDKPNAAATVTVQLVERALKGARKGTTEKIIGAIRRSYDYDHEEKRRLLESSLKQIGWQLVETISVPPATHRLRSMQRRIRRLGVPRNRNEPHKGH